MPGCDPRVAYGDLYGRGVRGIVLEAFGVGNMPWTPADNKAGWIPWLRGQRKQGMCIYLTSQCESGDLHPELYQSGSLALELGQARHQTQLALYQMELARYQMELARYQVVLARYHSPY